MADGYLPAPEDLTALRGLTRQPCGQTERTRRSRLAGRCHALAEAAVRERLALTTGQRHLVAVPSPAAVAVPSPAAPPSSLPTPVGGRIPMSSTEPGAEQPDAPQPRPHRMPTPAELFGRRPRPPYPARPARHSRRGAGAGHRHRLTAPPLEGRPHRRSPLRRAVDAASGTANPWRSGGPGLATLVG